MLEACGLKGQRIGGAQVSPKHANFIENAGGARSEDAVALMAEARLRAREQYGVELRHEVELLGELELPPFGRAGEEP
jgi:UDP-N-acetylmuramate dehydrogenase